MNDSIKPKLASYVTGFITADFFPQNIIQFDHVDFLYHFYSNLPKFKEYSVVSLDPSWAESIRIIYDIINTGIIREKSNHKYQACDILFFRHIEQELRGKTIWIKFIMEKQQNFQTSLESKYFSSEKAISNIQISDVPEESDAFVEFMLKNEQAV